MTAAPETNHAWLRKLVTGVPHMVIGGTNDPYLLRWYLIPRNPIVNVYLHKFLRSDDDRALHDHPWWFVSLILRGQYDEVTNAGRQRRQASARFWWGLGWSVVSLLMMRRNRRAGLTLLASSLFDIAEAAQRDGVLAFRPAEWRHRVQLISLSGPDLRSIGDLPCWTLIVTGRRSRTWGFWCPQLPHPRGWNRKGERFIPWQEFGDAGCGEPS